MIQNQLGYTCVIQALRTANALWKESRRFFAPYGLTEAQFNVLHLLGQQQQGMSQRELSELLLVDRSNITLLLDRMSAKDWIKRQDVPGDRRVYRVTLTKSGEALWKKVLPPYLTAMDSITKSFSTKDLQTLHALLQKLEKQAGSW